MLPARGPRPTLKGESVLRLRLMDDVQIPQVSQTNGPNWHFFGGPRPQNDSFYQDSAYHPANGDGSGATLRCRNWQFAASTSRPANSRCTNTTTLHTESRPSAEI